MQKDIIRIYKWATDNNMKFNNKKFELVSYSAKCRNLHKHTQHGFSFPFYYTKAGTLIQSFPSVHDLGVEMESGAAIDKQVSLVIEKESQFASCVLRVFRNKQNFALNAVQNDCFTPP